MPAPTDGWLPLTPAQRGLFFAHQLDPANPCYTTAEVVQVDAAEGRLDPARLREAVGCAYAEFEQLRVELALRPDGPVQRVRPLRDTGVVALPVVEVAGPDEAEEWMRSELARPLDLLGGELTRTALLRLPEADWWLHAAHHVVLDGYAVQQLLRRIAELYAGAPAAAPAVSLAEVVEPDDPGAKEFWAVRLDGYDGPASLAGVAAPPSATALRRAVELPD
ncbi:MAG: condensation domain-containing protein, partial [Nocardioides sp.]|uniref:condensation domain-containing protein n=1 Tax=Nocardioides sp. TaxID=35761 RepID=UPI0039E52147